MRSAIVVPVLLMVFSLNVVAREESKSVVTVESSEQDSPKMNLQPHKQSSKLNLKSHKKKAKLSKDSPKLNLNLHKDMVNHENHENREDNEDMMLSTERKQNKNTSDSHLAETTTHTHSIDPAPSHLSEAPYNEEQHIFQKTF